MIIIFDKVKKLSIIHTTWRDYCLLMLNSTPDPLRSIWREKLVTSIIHTEFNTGIISENTLAGLEILSSLPNEFTQKICDDSFTFGGWKKQGRIPGSKRMQVCLGHYPQEAISNEANLCLKHIIKHWNKYSHYILECDLLKRIWDFAQLSNGACLYPDEVLTYTLDKHVNPKATLNWINACMDVYANGVPSETYRKYYFCDKYLNWDKENGKLAGFPFELNADIEVQKKNFLDVCDVILKEDVNGCSNWKRICICILKNDSTMKYAGFTLTLRERYAREEALSAFSTKQKEKEDAEIELQKLIEKFKTNNNSCFEEVI